MGSTSASLTPPQSHFLPQLSIRGLEVKRTSCWINCVGGSVQCPHFVTTGCSSKFRYPSLQAPHSSSFVFRLYFTINNSCIFLLFYKTYYTFFRNTLRTLLYVLYYIALYYRKFQRGLFRQRTLQKVTYILGNQQQNVVLSRICY